MTPSLAWMRYLLILVPAAAGPYLTAIPSYPLYVFHLLLFLLIVRIRELAPLRLQWVMALAETAGGFLLAYEYNGFMFLLFASSLVSLFGRYNQPFRPLLAAILWAAMNASAQQTSPVGLVLANVLFLSEAYLLFRGLRAEVRQEELQQLYDELRKKHYELDEARKRIIDYARKVEDSAQAEERNRIAREIHDDLGHKLIRLKMMLDAVIQIMPVQADKGMEIIRQVRDQLTGSMETMRKTVRRLKPDETAVHGYSIEKLIEELSGDPGLTVEYNVHGMPYPIYPSCEIVLYRNAREAITNAIRHGKADQVAVDLYFQDKALVMKVSNNGVLPDRAGVEAKGLGVSGMEERTRFLGGSLSMEWTDRFTVITSIPVIRESN